VTSRRASLLGALGLLGALLAVGWWTWSARHEGRSSADRPLGESSLTATMRSEPATFNRYSGIAYPTHLVTYLTHARLVRVDRVTQHLEPWLAERWTTDDGRRFVLQLREGLVFSDGHPCTAEDVVFSFAAVYHPSTASPLADALQVDGKPLRVRALDAREVEIEFPVPYGPGLRILDGLPIYPKHRLEGALAAGTLASAWGPTTPPSDMAGLGPFVLESYEPGQRLVFTRNPHYWRTGPDGARLPRLDRLVLEIVPDQNAELLRLQAGLVDLLQNELRPEDYLPLKREADAGRLRLIEIGSSLDTHLLWFNLAGPRSDTRAWLQRSELRHAISYAVDRDGFVRSVYLGAADPAWGPITRANAEWYAADAWETPHDPDRARDLLAGIGLRDRDGDGTLEDDGGAAVQFTLLVQKGVTGSERGAAVIRDDLARIGVRVDVVALDLGAIMGRWSRRDYDAIYHYFTATDTDPAGNLDLWLSSGSAHLWNPRQPQPGTAWERRIDTLMQQQVAELDQAERQRLFTEVQRTFAEHRPVLAFAAPRVYVATSSRVTGLTPAVQRPQILWNADLLDVVERAAAAR
jgi:peptide/nickel transport system substrate-binding protein